MSTAPPTADANAPPPAEGGSEDAVAAFVAAATAPAAAAASTTDSNNKKRPAAAGNNNDKTTTTTTKKKKRRVLKKKISSKSWNDMFVQYVQFQAQHKKFSGKTPKMSPELDSFVRAQRQQYTANSNAAAASSSSNDTNPWALTPERIQVLNFVAFEWKEQTPQVQEYNKLWNERFLELSEYKRVHGHCNVPQGYGPLGKWVKHQREGKKEAERRAGEGQAGQNAAGGPNTKNKKVSTICLSQERIDKLDSIGFTWRRRGPMPDWEARYQQLIEYQRINGDTLVPQSYPPDTTFGKWVMKQRSEYSQRQRGMKSTMSDERMQKLNAIGFYWVSPKFNPKNRDASDSSNKRQPQGNNNSRPSPSRYGGSHNHYNADADRYHYI